MTLRQGLRLEQIVAYLQTLPLENLDIEEFYALATDPPQDLRDEFQWLDVIPEGRSVEGFLGAGVFDVEPDTDARAMLELLLQRWQDSPSFGLINQAQSPRPGFLLDRRAGEHRRARDHPGRGTAARRRRLPEPRRRTQRRANTERRPGADLRQGHHVTPRPAHQRVAQLRFLVTRWHRFGTGLRGSARPRRLPDLALARPAAGTHLLRPASPHSRRR